MIKAKLKTYVPNEVFGSRNQFSSAYGLHAKMSPKPILYYL